MVRGGTRKVKRREEALCLESLYSWKYRTYAPSKPSRTMVMSNPYAVRKREPLPNSSGESNHVMRGVVTNATRALSHGPIEKERKPFTKDLLDDLYSNRN